MCGFKTTPQQHTAPCLGWETELQDMAPESCLHSWQGWYSISWCLIHSILVSAFKHSYAPYPSGYCQNH